MSSNPAAPAEFPLVPPLSRRAKVLGTFFLVLQLTFAAWSFGPHRIPVLRWFVPVPSPAAAAPTAPDFSPAMARYHWSGNTSASPGNTDFAVIGNQPFM